VFLLAKEQLTELESNLYPSFLLPTDGLTGHISDERRREVHLPVGPENHAKTVSGEIPGQMSEGRHVTHVQNGRNTRR
jgi:hypothetical protein